MQDLAILIIRDKTTNESWECPVSGDTLVIGREESCDVSLGDRQVSRRHATIYRQGNYYFLRDLGSRNGTFANDNLVISPRQLQDGDEIRIAARFRIIFVASEATAPLYRQGPQRQGVSLEPGTRHVWVDGVKLDPPLSMAQFRLLEFLAAHGGEVCSRQQVIEAVYADESAEGITDQAIDALIRRLRERLSATGSQHALIETVRGAGFRLRQPE
jgi:DNA-binding winged helix-turn-helix (wHTH) protein